MTPTIQIKRVYDKPSKKDGYRVLTDRLWPRGLAKANAAVDEWGKELAPSTALRKWFAHDPERRTAFEKKYLQELKKNDYVKIFAEDHKAVPLITLLYAVKDPSLAHAPILQHYLEQLYRK
jgi:uncharacterized protein YeaO (DUF488 family)